MNTVIYLDIETIPTQRDDVRAFIAKSVTHPGNIKKADSIAAWNENEKPAAVEEAVSKTGLDGAFGQVVCVGMDLRDDGEPLVISGLSEADVLRAVNEAMKAEFEVSDGFSTTIVGHNVSAFDLRFLVQRYIVNGIKPHQIIARAAQAKPWEAEKVYDTMVQFAGVGNRISLDKLCLALGLPGKGDITGADVWPMVQDGRLQEVADYCADDVRKTRAVFKRMTFAN
jgi:predicted PolB exonuclease-like 3'-5' exonuclease